MLPVVPICRLIHDFPESDKRSTGLANRTEGHALRKYWWYIQRTCNDIPWGPETPTATYIKITLPVSNDEISSEVAMPVQLVYDRSVQRLLSIDRSTCGVETVHGVVGEIPSETKAATWQAPVFYLDKCRLMRLQRSMGSNECFPTWDSSGPRSRGGGPRLARLGQHEDTAWFEFLAKGADFHSSLSERKGQDVGDEAVRL
ncbi:hypothetical protein JB92DRAFT_2836127 [Gautieria morchelliformis]|nr:hypothetical protein JB92DRAFT_2836127 [Gautieria morchelliformis]